MTETTQKRRDIYAAILRYGGVVALTASLSAAAGFWLAEISVRWLPTMLSIITSIALLALIAMTAAAFLSGRTLKQTDKGLKMRRRVKTLLMLIVLAGFARLGAYCISTSCKLTALPADSYEAVFASDYQRFAECDRGLRECLAAIEQMKPLFESDQTATKDEELHLRQIWRQVYDYGYCLDSIRQFHENWHRFDPARSMKKYHLRSFMLCFGSDMVLYEYARDICHTIEANENVVKFLNSTDSEGQLAEDSFSRFRNQLTNTAQSARITAGVGYFLWLDKMLSASELATELNCRPLWQRIADGSESVYHASRTQQLEIAVKGDCELLKTSIRRSWFPLQKNVAEWMGHTRVQRVGKYLIDDKLGNQFLAKLAPGDILLGRKNWYLSNVGLPGFWPHALLYVGTPQQIKENFDADTETREYIKARCGEDMGLTEYLSKTFPIKWRQYKVGDGKSPAVIIEAVSAGVVSHSFSQARGDYMVAMRPRLSKAVKAAAIIEAFEHLGKPYDYEFDFATDHALVCTELVWRCYRPAAGKDGLTLGPIDYAGRKTLPANEIALAFAADAAKTDATLREFDFVMFIDANEAQQKAFISDEKGFLQSAQRSKWSAQQD